MHGKKINILVSGLRVCCSHPFLPRDQPAPGKDRGGGCCGRQPQWLPGARLLSDSGNRKLICTLVGLILGCSPLLWGWGAPFSLGVLPRDALPPQPHRNVSNRQVLSAGRWREEGLALSVSEMNAEGRPWMHGLRHLVSTRAGSAPSRLHDPGASDLTLFEPQCPQVSNATHRQLPGVLGGWRVTNGNG